MQPTYLPWSGYFNLISLVDVFVFLDDAQYVKQEWINRNRIIVNGREHFLTVPVCHDRLSQKINEVQIQDKRLWRKDHCLTIKNVYARLHIDQLEEVLNIITNTDIKMLCELNIKIIIEFCKILNCSPKFLRSSELGILGKRTERLVKICETLGCDEYISPIGAKQYIEEDGHFSVSVSRVKLTFQNFTPVPYPQRRVPTFISHLSIVDVLAHLGKEDAKKYVRGEYMKC